MKIVFYLSLLVVGFVGVNYASKYMMGGIESGLAGNKGVFKEYHEDNLFAKFLKNIGMDKKTQTRPSTNQRSAPILSRNSSQRTHLAPKQYTFELWQVSHTKQHSSLKSSQQVPSAHLGTRTPA